MARKIKEKKWKNLNWPFLIWHSFASFALSMCVFVFNPKPYGCTHLRSIGTGRIGNCHWGTISKEEGQLSFWVLVETFHTFWLPTICSFSIRLRSNGNYCLVQFVLHKHATVTAMGKHLQMKVNQFLPLSPRQGTRTVNSGCAFLYLTFRFINLPVCTVADLFGVDVFVPCTRSIVPKFQIASNSDIQH